MSAYAAADNREARHIMRIRIHWGRGEVFGTIEDTATGKALYAALPIDSEANTWGDVVYFTVPVEMPLDDAPQQVVPPGTICYWAQGRSMAIPFGPTPISEGKECRLVTAVNVCGQLEGDARRLVTVSESDRITVEAAE